MKPRQFLYLLLLIFGAAALFKDSFTNYFFSDDFFHIFLTNSQGLLDAFNLFRPAALDYYIYRPLATQVFWALTTALFGWEPFGYHLIYFLFFAINIFLLWKVIDDKKVANIAVFLYAFSATHFYRLFFLSTFQEVLMATMTLLTVILYKKNNWLCLLTFILALMCKETAIVTPGILFLIKRDYRKIFMAGIIAAIFFIGRKFFFGFYSGGEYVFDFNPLKVANNYFWYFLWTLGVPEHYMNVRLFEWTRFFTDFGKHGLFIAIAFLLFLLSTVLTGLSWVKSRAHFKSVFLGAVIFIAYILPVGFFPFHKFASSLTIPLMGVCVILAVWFSKPDKIYLTAVLCFYVVLAFFSLQYAQETHWNTTRAKLAANTINFFKEVDIKNYDNVYFTGGKNSTELNFALSGSYALRVYFKNSKLNTYFEGSDQGRNLTDKSLVVDSNQFFGVN